MTLPPITPIKPHELTIHGHTRIDNYYWLREKENPEVAACLKAEDENELAARQPCFRQLRLVYQSLTTADTTYNIDMDSLAWTFRKQEPVLGGCNPDDYVTERHLAAAVDEAQAPISLGSLGIHGFLHCRGGSCTRPPLGDHEGTPLHPVKSERPFL